jgi:hypothetical protein
MTVDIKLRRKKVVMPDEGRVIRVVWEDIFNPLRDENGIVIRTDVFNPATGLLFPAYPEFAFSIMIPDPAPATQTEVNALIDNSAELQEAKKQAQTRANNYAAKTSIRNFVNVLNSSNKIDFEGNYVIPV